MSHKGGYKIIDLKDHDFTIGGDGVTINGIYSAIENSYRKSILLSGLVVEGVERNDRFCVFGINEGDYVSIIAISANIDTLKLTVTDEDLVTLTENV